MGPGKGFVKGDPEGILYGQWAPPTFIDNSYQFQGMCILSEAESGKTLWNMKNISSALVKTIDMVIHKKWNCHYSLKVDNESENPGHV